MKKSTVCRLVIVLIAGLTADTFAFAANYSQPPIMLEARKVLPAELLKGKNFSIDAQIRNDGLINFYMLDTDYGRLSAEGTEELKIRIAELNALVIMEELERSEVFKESLVKGVKAPVEGVKALVTEPVDTTKDIVKGTGQFLSNIGQAFVSDDPAQDNALKVALGYDAAKRQFAYEFGINPYSDYEPVVDRLGEIARAAVAGGLTPKATLAAVDHSVATGAQVSGTARGMQKLVRDNPPNKLREINKGKLTEMGVSEDLAEAFLDNYSYDPQEKTLLIGELTTMKDVKGRDAFISRANLATEQSAARFYRSAAQLMGRYHRKLTPVAEILDTKGVLNLQKKDGGRVILSPVDHVFWTQRLESKLNSFEAALQQSGFSGEKEIWITGVMDQGAKTQFEQAGWKVTENAQDKLLKP